MVRAMGGVAYHGAHAFTGTTRAYVVHDAAASRRIWQACPASCQFEFSM